MEGDVEERMARLRPSERLVDYYRKKVKEWREKYGRLERMAEEAVRLCERSWELDSELAERTRETGELRKALGAVQGFLYRERELALSLGSEAEESRAERSRDAKKIETLMAVCDLREADFKPWSVRKGVKGGKTAKEKRLLTEFTEKERDCLVAKVGCLRKRLESETGLLKEEIAYLEGERSAREGEWEAERERLERRIACLNCRERETKSRVASGVLGELREERAAGWEKSAAVFAETERLRQCLEDCERWLGPEGAGPPRASDLRLREELRRLRGTVLERDAAAEGYRLQAAGLKEDLQRAASESTKEKERAAEEKRKLAQRNRYLEKKLDEERKRRLAEGEGFRNDVKHLRIRLQKIERQIRLEKIKKNKQPSNDCDN